MGIMIQKRFGPQNFVQCLLLKPRKKQQVCLKNPQEYIISQNVVSSVLQDRQQSVNVETQGATKHFANYYAGTRDTTIPG